MKILVVEDDYLQVEWLSEQLKNHIEEVQVESISTESKFYDSLARIAAQPPDIILMDVMLRWTDPAPHMLVPPDDVREEGFYTAGLRCERKLRQNSETSTIPVILYTMLEQSDLLRQLEGKEDNTIYCRKEADLHSLIQKIRELVDYKLVA